MSGDGIDLQTLWVPVVPDTSKVGKAMEDAGKEAKERFSRGVQGIGDTLGQGLAQGITGADLPAGLDHLIATLSQKTGVMAGLIGGAVSAGLNVVIHGAEKMVEAVTESVQKAAEEILHVGDAWEQVGRQLESTTNISDAAMERLTASARQLVSSGLDTSMDNLGKTMGVLSSRLGLEAGPALESLTRHLLELNDRFGDVNVNTFTEALDIFKVSGQDADNVLASLLESARGSGESLGVLISNLGEAGRVLSEAGLSVEQAGHLVAEVDKLGLPIARLSTAEKEFTKMGLTFGDGMKYAAEALVALGDTVEGQALAMKLFGARGWSGAMAIVQAYVDTVNAVPGAYDAAGTATDQYLKKTETLGNKWTELKQKAEVMLAPLGETALTGLAAVLQHFSDYVTEHHDDIVAKIKDFGDKFIDTLPQLKEFAATGIEVMGKFFDFIKSSIAATGAVLSLLEWMWAKVTGDDEGVRKADELAKAMGKLEDMDFGKAASTLADTIRGIDTSTDTLNGYKSALDGVADSMKDPVWSRPPTVGLPGGAPYGGGPTSPASPLAPFDTGGVAGSPGQGFPLPWNLPGTGGVGAAESYAASQSGKPYEYGGVGAGGGSFDCSGYVSSVWGVMTGRGPGRHFNTESDFAALGFKRGHKSGAFNIGIHHGGGGPNSHMAATFPDGTRIESNGSGGVQYGGNAAGAEGSEFEDHWYYPISDAGSLPSPGSFGGAGGMPGRGGASMGFPMAPAPPPPGPGGLGDLGQVWTVPPATTPGAPGAPAAPGTPGPVDPNNPFLAPGRQPYVQPYSPFPMPQYYPLTPYPGEAAAGGLTEDQWNSRAKAVQSATTGKYSADLRVHQAEQNLERLQNELDVDTGKRKATDQQLEDATRALIQARIDDKEATDNLSEAQRKAGEPLKAKDKAGGSDAGSMGQGLLRGLLSDIGLDGSILSDPTQWGITKLLTGGLNFGMGLMQHMGEKPTGMFGPGGPLEGQNWGGPVSNGGGGLPLGMIPGIDIASAVTPTATASGLGPAELSQFPTPTPGGAAPPVPHGGAGGAPPGPGGTQVNFNGPVTTQDPKQLVPQIKEYSNANSRYTQSAPHP